MTFEVWQVLVKGRKPEALPGAHDELFRKISLPTTSCASPVPYEASAPAELKGRKYSGRALDYIRERRLTADRVEKVLASRDKRVKNGVVTYYDTESDPDIFYVKVDTSGTVISMQ